MIIEVEWTTVLDLSCTMLRDCINNLTFLIEPIELVEWAFLPEMILILHISQVIDRLALVESHRRFSFYDLLHYRCGVNHLDQRARTLITLHHRSSLTLRSLAENSLFLSIVISDLAVIMHSRLILLGGLFSLCLGSHSWGGQLSLPVTAPLKTTLRTESAPWSAVLVFQGQMLE